MIEPSVLIAYTLIVLGFVFIPGPATLLTVARATGSGTRAGLATAAGIALGDVLHTVFAVVGLSAIVLTSATLFTLVKILGAGYLIWIGVMTLLARPGQSERSAARITPRRAFRQAILAEVLNPKTALFFLAFLPQFVDPSRGMVMGQLAVFGAIMIVLGFLATVLFALAAGRVSDVIRENAAFQRWQARITGTLYCGLGLRIALADR
ncbi:MAG: LysE family translocator [Pseudomonadota bacterium]